MMRSTLGAPLGGTTRGGHHGVESVALSLITPPNCIGGGGSCFPSSVIVALGEPSSPVTCCAATGVTTSVAATRDARDCRDDADLSRVPLHALCSFERSALLRAVAPSSRRCSVTSDGPVHQARRRPAIAPGGRRGGHHPIVDPVRPVGAEPGSRGRRAVGASAVPVAPAARRGPAIGAVGVPGSVSAGRGAAIGSRGRCHEPIAARRRAAPVAGAAPRPVAARGASPRRPCALHALPIASRSRVRQPPAWTNAAAGTHDSRSDHQTGDAR